MAAAMVNAVLGTGVRALTQLDHRQGIHVRTQTHAARAVALAQHTHHAGTTHALMHLGPKQTQ
ncbi:hypothetical protein GALL_456540 [mine drainage metagenome]|uniref:Uncharacterized protein n=1 Tax=mine drainage metagenome TaxID=410659 RepID=A0A1J5PMF2_9ZZZZ